jgi:hypothetical protein
MDMHLDCECGFVGSIREQETPLGTIGRCFGCDRLYKKGTGELMAGIPEFKSFDDMQKFLDKATTGKAPTGTKPNSKPNSKSKRSRNKRKPAEKDSSTEIEHKEPAGPVYKTIHFYLRPGDSWPEVLKDGREEIAGPTTLVFCHNHLHGEACVDTCRSMA